MNDLQNAALKDRGEMDTPPVHNNSTNPPPLQPKGLSEVECESFYWAIGNGSHLPCCLGTVQVHLTFHDVSKAHERKSTTPLLLKDPQRRPRNLRAKAGISFDGRNIGPQLANVD